MPKGAEYRLLELHHSPKYLNDPEVVYCKLNPNSTNGWEETKILYCKVFGSLYSVTVTVTDPV